MRQAPSIANPVLEKLQALRNHGSRFGIERMAELDTLIGAPSRRFPAIHVAGTNGKGSTSAMIEAIQRAHGRTTGLYTSPHLVRLGERVQVNRRPLSEKVILEFCDELFPAAEELGKKDAELYPSFFEFMTAMAFLTFARQPVDVGVIEVGLGGRLDATNILTPRVCVITSIGLDHTDMLGDTIEKIAGEKAGILKPSVPLALGLVSPEAEAVIRARAAEVGAPVFSVRERFDFSKSENLPETNLAGDYQRANAALALLACELAGKDLPVDETTARRALAHVEWVARWQAFPLSGDRRLILDVAHNEEGARALESNLEKLVRDTGRKPLVITGVLGLDRAKPLFEVFAKYAGELILVRPDQERACSLDDLAACVPVGYTGPVRRSTVAGLFPEQGVCTVGAPGETVVVAGSVYLAGEVLSRFAEDKSCDEYTKLQDKLPGTKNAGA
jgi:dihydrofolate synthase/folylpolyglutamate synthase